MSNEGKVSVTLAPFPTILVAIFITLKLTNHITWSWVWVLSPFWIPLGLVLVIGVIAFITIMVGTLFSRNKKK